MNQINWKKLLSRLLVAFFVPLVWSTSAAAAGSSAFDQTGSIRITLRAATDQSPILGAQFTLYQAGEWKGGEMGFDLTAAFQAAGISLTRLQEQGLADHLAAYAQDAAISGTVMTTTSEGVTFESLKPGLYLALQSNVLPTHYSVPPMLFSLPMADASSNWIYDIAAEPKVELRPDQAETATQLSVVKVWQDDGTGRPEGIQVQLLKEGALADTVTLDAENKWRHDWTGLDTRYRWSAVEKRVPLGYGASYLQEGKTIRIVNTKTGFQPEPEPTEPGEPADPGQGTPEEPVPPLIQTGQLQWPIQLLVVSGLLLFASGWLMDKKAKNGRTHEA